MAKIKNEKAPKKEAKSVVLETPAQRLSGIIKTCRKIMRKDKGMNGDGDRLPMRDRISIYINFTKVVNFTHLRSNSLTHEKYMQILSEINSLLVEGTTIENIATIIGGI